METSHHDFQNDEKIFKIHKLKHKLLFFLIISLIFVVILITYILYWIEIETN